MLKTGVSLLTPLLFLVSSPLPAQDAPGNTETSPAVDTISPVPAPEITSGSEGISDFSMPKNLKISNDGGTISGSPDTGIKLGGPVKIQGDNGLQIYSNQAQLDLKTKTVTLIGNVTVYQGDTLQRGSRAVYNYETKHLDTSDLRASIDPILLESGKFESRYENGRAVFVGKNAGITTHDVENPNYWIRANETRIYPGDKVVFENMTLYAGGIPVFWLPYLSQPLNAELGYHFQPGMQTGWGAYLLNTYGIMLGGEEDPITGVTHDAWLLSQWHFDLRSRRGVGVGVDLVDTTGVRSEEISGLSLYYMHDQSPSVSRSGVPRNFSDDDRYSIELKQRYPLDFADEADWRLDTNLTYFSDRYYLEDLDQDLYRHNPAPDNTIGLYRRSDTTLLSLFTRYQVNDFYRADSRLPEIALDIPKTALFDTPLLHEGSYTFSVIREDADTFTKRNVIQPLSQLPVGDLGIPSLINELSGYERILAQEMVTYPVGDPRRENLRRQLSDAGYTRFRAYEQVALPTMVGEVLSLTPEIGAGYTRYTHIAGAQDGFDRTHFHASLEAAIKFSRDYGNIQNQTFGLNGLLHVFQPYAKWSYISTNDYAPGDPGVDRLTPTTRPRPLDPTRFVAVDQMEQWNIVRLGGRNRLITHRDNTSYEWLYLDTYIDFYLDDVEGDREMSNLYNDLRWAPVPWMNVEIETQFPITSGASGYSEFSSRASFMPNEDFDFSVGYRWLEGHPVLPDSSRFNLNSYTHVSENWGVGTRHSVEMDDGTLEYQQYTLHRDLGNWVAGMGFTVRDNRLQDEYGVIFTLTLKDFPSVSLPFEYDRE